MAELQGRVRERVRAELVRHGASAALEDPALFADIDALLRAAIERSQPAALLLPVLLGHPSTWRPVTAITSQAHRGASVTPIIFVKQRVLMPLLRWFYEFNRDNFERQRRINQVLFACVQELAIELAKQRRELQALSAQSIQRRP